VTTRQQLTGYRLTGYNHALLALAEAIDDQRLTRKDLAKPLGIGAQTLSNGLRGRHRMDGRILFGLADQLGYDLALIPREDT